MAHRLVVDSSCIGCNICVDRACHTFALYNDENEETKSKVINQNGDSETKITAAINDCPVNAISWQEA